MLPFFIRKNSTTALYSLYEIRTIVNAYVSANKLADAKDQQLVNLDELLLSALSPSGKSSASQTPLPQLMRREEITKRLSEKMQPWHTVDVEGKDSVVRHVNANGRPIFSSFISQLQEGPAEAHPSRDENQAGTQGVHAYHQF
jgi:hypothetical protein